VNVEMLTTKMLTKIGFDAKVASSGTTANALIWMRVRAKINFSCSTVARSVRPLWSQRTKILRAKLKPKTTLAQLKVILVKVNQDNFSAGCSNLNKFILRNSQYFSLNLIFSFLFPDPDSIAYLYFK